MAHHGQGHGHGILKHFAVYFKHLFGQVFDPLIVVIVTVMVIVIGHCLFNILNDERQCDNGNAAMAAAMAVAIRQ